MGTISHHIMPLVINSFGGGHTHTHMAAGQHVPGLTIYRAAVCEAILYLGMLISE